MLFRSMQDMLLDTMHSMLSRERHARTDVQQRRKQQVFNNEEIVLLESAVFATGSTAEEEEGVDWNATQS